MAEAAVSSAFLQVVFQIAGDFLKEELKLEHDLEKDVKALEKNLDMVRPILNDAEKRGPSEALKQWLDQLRDAGYDAIDVLDEHNTELLRRNLVPLHELRNDLSIINPKRIFYRHGMSQKIKDVSLEMDRVIQRGSNFGLNVSASSPVRVRLEKTASLPPTLIVGREHKKNEILNMLIRYGEVQGEDPNLLILAIHGMGRIGKTTLAQLIYNDKKTLKHFEMRLWVHVSCEYNLEEVTCSILNSIDEQSCHGINLNTLQSRIQVELKGKRYLLVLDNFSSENPHEWEKLIRPLHEGAPGSAIIVTTRTEFVAKMVAASTSYHLKNLSESDCYSLIKHYASCNDERACAKLHALRSKIFRKHEVMPEEAIDLGYLLRGESNIEKWDEIIKRSSEGFQGERDKFISDMRMSYSQLPSCLKPCLAYCSIIPKDHLFEKEWVVQLWMAQNFIAEENEKMIEEVGHRYFSWLVDRSFFQRAVDHNMGRDKYVIPDVVHRLAQHIAVEECCIFEPGKPHNLTRTTRHMSIVFPSDLLTYTSDPFTGIHAAKSLYTLLVFGYSSNKCPLKLSDDLLNSLGRLRTLDLSNCYLAPLPNNIGDLKHLRYLKLCNTNIQELPESTGNLYNLRTLGLRNCFHLRKLPKETRCLLKLQHLDLHLDHKHPFYGNLESMPPHMGLLTNLQVLSQFVISTGRYCGISELMNLNSLQGELSIKNLNLVKDPDDAAKANLEEKKHINQLEFLWRGEGGLHKCSRERKKIELIFEKLKPSNTIKELNIVGYTGEILPSWLKSDYLTNLHTIFLSDCPNCIVLPTLGNLPLLQNLHIKGMHSLNSINCDFCSTNPFRFPSLKKIVLENMTSFVKWTGDENCELPHLSELVLKDCAILQRLTHNFPSLTKLTIEKSSALLGLRRYPSLKYLKVMACGDWIWGSWPCLSSLFSLTLSQLPSKIFPANLPKVLDSLRSLEISHCNNLTTMPDNWIPSGITSLRIRHCPMLRQLPGGIQTLKSLEGLEIQDCEGLELLPELKNLKSLTMLTISGCHSFKSLPREGLPDHLHFISISDCRLFSKQFEDLKSPDRIKIRHVFSVWIDQKCLSSTACTEESSSSRR